MLHRRAATAAILMTLALAGAGPALAQPGKTTRIVVSFPPGGPVDFVARALGEQLGKELQHTVIIDNKGGANGAIGASEVMRAPADGSTLWITSVGAAAVNPSLYEKLPYDMQRDFAPVSLVANNVELLVVNPADPAKTAAEFVANAKKAKPPVAMGSSGIGSIPHLAIEQLIDASGAPITHIPYRGAAPAITDMIAGHVHVMFDNIPTAAEQVKAGTLRGLAVTSEERSETLPELPTVASTIPGYEASAWYGLGAPKATPREIIDVLNRSVNEFLADAAAQKRLKDLGASTLPGSPQDFGKLLADETEKWGKVVKFAGAKPG